MSRSKTEIAALTAAYEISFLVAHNCENVISGSDENDDCTTDKEWLENANTFKKWYEENIIAKGFV